MKKTLLILLSACSSLPIYSLDLDSELAHILISNSVLIGANYYLQETVSPLKKYFFLRKIRTRTLSEMMQEHQNNIPAVNNEIAEVEKRANFLFKEAVWLSGRFHLRSVLTQMFFHKNFKPAYQEIKGPRIGADGEILDQTENQE